MASTYRIMAGLLCLGGALVAVGFVLGAYCSDGCHFPDNTWETLPSDLEGMVGQLRGFVDHSKATVHNPLGSSVPGCEETDEGCFIPSTVTINVGGEVTWVNDDGAAHTATSGVLTDGGPDGVFDSGLFMPATSFSHKFEKAGEYPYFCLVHPWMKGLVVVR